MSKKKKLAAGAIALLAICIDIYIALFVRASVWPAMVCVGLCSLVAGMAIWCAVETETCLRLPLELYRDRAMFVALAKNDFQARFAGSYLGLFWAFVQPLITIGLYWFVFQVGLRSGTVSDHPFILYLMAGLVPWFYFSEALSGATTALPEYSYLVKKLVFNVNFLPAIKVFSAMFVHLFFVLLVFIVSLCYGYMPDLYLLQIFYYIACTAFLALGLSYITSALTVFFRDMAQIVSIVLTVGMWATPILWNADVLESFWLRKLFELNPVYYIVSGFRASFLDKTWFWNEPVWSIYFWCVAIGIYLIGIKLFNKLKVHFSDVL